jgi:hypothetical protein
MIRPVCDEPAADAPVDVVVESVGDVAVDPAPGVAVVFVPEADPSSGFEVSEGADA